MVVETMTSEIVSVMYGSTLWYDRNPIFVYYKNIYKGMFR